MDAIEKRARELLAAEYRARGELWHAMNLGYEGRRDPYAAEVAAIIAALTPPEGYVLVPVDTLQDLAADAEEYVRSTEFRRDRVETKLASVREAQAILAACPEVP